jgi:selenocysteine-specific elongation factor
MLVATAGHIDHGKTSLIRALTGVETDRLPEERARGISIDLGFAYWPLEDGSTIGFVDVPGHERFVRNMLAGVGAVDFALLVVAADDGVMPQSLEHVQILDLLGIAHGIVAITKCDRSSRERIDAVRAQVSELLASTALAGMPVFEVSSVTGAGIAALGDALRAAAQASVLRPTDGRNFRMAVDRAFSVAGAGTVVTGTVIAGDLQTGERLVLSPRGLEARVRGLQSGGKTVTNVRAGERCAVNLAGVDLGQVHRGDWLLTAEMHVPTARVEVRLRVLQSKGGPLKHHTPVHLHVGTADIGARVLIPGQAAIPPGDEAIVQLVLERPICAVIGDRFVLRDQSGRQSIGGGCVVDPFVLGDRRNQAGRPAISAALQLPCPGQAFAALLTRPGQEIDTLLFERRFNLQAAAAQDIYRNSGAVLLGTTHTLALPAERVAAIGEHMVALLTNLHREHPEVAGMTARTLKAQLKEDISTPAFLALQRELIEKRQIELSGGYVKLPGHAASFSPAENILWQKLQLKMENRNEIAFTTRDLVSDLQTGESAIKSLLYRKRSTGEVWRITDDRFLLRKQAAALAARAAVLASEIGGKGFTAAQYRDAIGTGRTIAIHILEFFDSIGVTYRNGDLRKIRRDFALTVGNSQPFVPPPPKLGSAPVNKTSAGRPGQRKKF